MNEIFENGFLNIYYENVDGLTQMGKMRDLSISTTAADYDVITISETWLDSTIFNQEFISNDYVVFRKDRQQSSIDASKCGGVLIAVRTGLKSEQIST